MYLWTAAPHRSKDFLQTHDGSVCLDRSMSYQFACFMATIFLNVISQLCEIRASSQEGAYYSEVARHLWKSKVMPGCKCTEFTVCGRIQGWQFWHLLYLPCDCPTAPVPHKWELWPGSQYCRVCSKWLPAASLSVLGLAFAFCYTYSVSS